MRGLLKFSWSPWKSEIKNIQMAHMISYIIMRPCRYIEFCVNTSWKISSTLQPRNVSNISDLSPPFFSSLILLSSPYWRSADWRRQAPLSSSSRLFRQRVMWLEPCDLHQRKPWCIQEIIRATQARFRGMQIFSECLKNNTTHTYTHCRQILAHPPAHSHTH